MIRTLIAVVFALVASKSFGVVIYPGGFYWFGNTQVVCAIDNINEALPLCDRSGIEFAKDRCFTRFNQIVNRNECAAIVSSSRYMDQVAADHCFAYNSVANVHQCLRSIADRQYDGQSDRCFAYNNLNNVFSCLTTFGSWARCN